MNTKTRASRKKKTAPLPEGLPPVWLTLGVCSDYAASAVA